MASAAGAYDHIRQGWHTWADPDGFRTNHWIVTIGATWYSVKR